MRWLFRFLAYWVADDASFCASLVAAVGGAALAVSLLAALVVGLLVGGVDGAEATAGSGMELGFEVVGMEAGSVFSAAGLGEGGAEATLGRLELVLAATFLEDFVATLAGSAGALGALAPLRFGAGADAGAASATLAGLSRVSVVGVGAASAGAEVFGAAVPECVLLTVRAAVGGAWISTSLYLLLKNSAPPSTDAVMTPKAIPKWFTGTPCREEYGCDTRSDSPWTLMVAPGIPESHPTTTA